MNDRDSELFEAELRKLAPAKLPDNLRIQLMSAGHAPRSERGLPERSGPAGAGWRWLRWLAPATAAAAVALALASRWAGPSAPSVLAVVRPTLRAHDVEIDQQLVAAFDTVARMPDGAPVRLRCREWADQVVLQDSARGVVVEQNAPRLEVVPVGFEIY